MPDHRLPLNAPHATPTPPPAHALRTDAGARRRYISEHLFGEHTEVEIQHGESTYRLRLTSLGKLILTK
jgi:hemin uptake protein HemP